MSAVTLNKKLADMRVQFNQSGVWFLYSTFQDKGYTSTKTHSYSKNNGTLGSKSHMYWTQKGRLFLYDLLKTKGIVPMIEREDDVLCDDFM
jgi:phage antirepressor YoqD-like protein